MSEPSFVGVTPGSGAEKVATYKISEGGTEVQLGRQVLNDADGAELKGRKEAAAGLPFTLSIEDLAALLSLASATGFVAIPASDGTALTADTAPRAILVATAGNLVVELMDGSSNASKPIAVPAGVTLPLRAVRLGAGNTAGIIGIKN